MIINNNNTNNKWNNANNWVTCLSLRIRGFRTCNILRMNSDILAKLESSRLALESQIKAAKEGQAILNEGKKDLADITKRLVSLGKKSQKEREDMTSYLEHFSGFMAKADKPKVQNLLEEIKQKEESFDNKMKDELYSDNVSMLNFIKIMKDKEKSMQKTEDNAEALINKSVEKCIAKEGSGTPFEKQYLVSRLLRLKERSEFKEEKDKVLSDSSSRLSPIDFVVDLMETEMPSYTEPED